MNVQQKDASLENVHFGDSGERFVKTRFVWKIRDFAKLMQFSQAERQEEMESDGFTVAIDYGRETGPDLHHFQLKLCWNNEKGEKEHLGLFLQLKEIESGVAETVTLTAKLAVLAADGGGAAAAYESGCIKMWGDRAVGSRELIKKADLWEEGVVDKEGAVTMACDVEIYTCDKVNAGSRVEKRPELKCPTLGEQMASMGEDAKEVLLVCRPGGDGQPTAKTRKKRNTEVEDGDCGVRCHKVVLTSRSDVFRAMFSHRETAESRSNVVVVEDVLPETLREFVDFLYTDTCGTLSENDLDRLASLVAVADKYNVESLKQRCEEALVPMICEEGKLQELIRIGEMHQCHLLMRATTAHLANQFRKAVKMPWFGSLSGGVKLKVLDLLGQQGHEIK